MLPPPEDMRFQEPHKRQIGSICSKTLVRLWKGFSRVTSPLIGNVSVIQPEPVPSSASQTAEPSKVLPQNGAVRSAKREERLAQYQHMLALREQGFSQTAIAGQVGISHATVSRWLSNGTFPEQKPRPRSASVDPSLPRLVERWKEGLHTGAEVHRELVADGYSHQYHSVYRRLTRSFPEGRKQR